MKFQFFKAVQYFKMPELNKFSDFDACMGVFSKEAKYCYVKTALKPDESSELYKYIREFSNMKKQHFRHDKLARGVCLNTCSKIISDMGLESDKYFVPKFALDYAVSNQVGQVYERLLRPNIFPFR